MSTMPRVQVVTSNVVSGPEIHDRNDDWALFVRKLQPISIGADPRWLLALADGMGHVPYCIEAHSDGELVGLLPLSLVRGPIFGRFLVSLPYVSTCGCTSLNSSVETPL